MGQDNSWSIFFYITKLPINLPAALRSKTTSITAVIINDENISLFGANEVITDAIKPITNSGVFGWV